MQESPLEQGDSSSQFHPVQPQAQVGVALMVVHPITLTPTPVSGGGTGVLGGGGGGGGGGGKGPISQQALISSRIGPRLVEMVHWVSPIGAQHEPSPSGPENPLGTPFSSHITVQILPMWLSPSL